MFRKGPPLVKTFISSNLGYMTPVQWADFYHTVFNFQVFFGPAIAIVASYTRIYILLKKRTNSTLCGQAEVRSVAETILFEKRQKNLMKALKMSIMHCAVFVMSWTPYTVMATW